jgi:hypothetical protein
VFVIDPFQLSGIRSSTWSAVHSAETWDGALSSAYRLASAGQVESRNVKGGDYWSAAAEQRLAPLLFAAARSGRDIRAVVRWGYGQGEAELPAILHKLVDEADTAAGRADAQAAFDAHSGFIAQAGDTRSSVESTVQLLLRAYRSPAVQQSALSCEITGERLFSGANTLYLIGHPHRSKLTSGTSSTTSMPTSPRRRTTSSGSWIRRRSTCSAAPSRRRRVHRRRLLRRVSPRTCTDPR